MDNVIPFVRKENNTPPTLQYQSMSDLIPEHYLPTPLRWSLDNFHNSSYLQEVGPWGEIIRLFARGYEHPMYLVIFADTAFREQEAPEFGIQDHIEFLQIILGFQDEEPEVEPLPTSLLDVVFNYTSKFNDQPVSYHLSVVVALLTGIIEHPDVRFRRFVIEEGVLKIQFVDNNKTDKGWLTYQFTFNFLPLILDTAATQWLTELNQT